MPTAITALREAFAARARGEGNIVARTRWEFGDRRLNVMGGGLTTQRRFALKSYGSSTYHVLLYSQQDGLVAVIEANVLGQIRTGRQARTQALALGSAGLLQELAVFARSRDKLEGFCTALAKELHAPVTAA